MATVTAGEKFTVIRAGIEYEFELAEEGGYLVSVPLYPSCVSDGDTFEEALENIEDALHETLAAAKDLDLEIPESCDRLLIDKTRCRGGCRP